jgi:hypothetical protein
MRLRRRRAHLELTSMVVAAMLPVELVQEVVGMRQDQEQGALV